MFLPDPRSPRERKDERKVDVERQERKDGGGSGSFITEIRIELSLCVCLSGSLGKTILFYIRPLAIRPQGWAKP